MKRIADSTGVLIWRRAGFFSRRYDLLEGTESCCTMRMLGLSNTAEAVTSGATWRCRIVGFWRQQIECVDPQTGRVLARIESKTFGRDGTLVVGEVARYSMRYERGRPPSLLLEDTAGRLLVRQEVNIGHRFEGTVVLEPAARADRNLALVVALLWYVALVRRG
jgi:hypothetical protein